MKDEKGEEATGIWSYLTVSHENERKWNHLHNVEVQSETASDDIETVASYPKDLAKVVN